MLFDLYLFCYFMVDNWVNILDWLIKLLPYWLITAMPHGPREHPENDMRYLGINKQSSVR